MIFFSRWSNLDLRLFRELNKGEVWLSGNVIALSLTISNFQGVLPRFFMSQIWIKIEHISLCCLQVTAITSDPISLCYSCTISLPAMFPSDVTGLFSILTVPLKIWTAGIFLSSCILLWIIWHSTSRVNVNFFVWYMVESVFKVRTCPNTNGIRNVTNVAQALAQSIVSPGDRNPVTAWLIDSHLTTRLSLLEIDVSTDPRRFGSDIPTAKIRGIYTDY